MEEGQSVPFHLGREADRVRPVEIGTHVVVPLHDKPGFGRLVNGVALLPVGGFCIMGLVMIFKVPLPAICSRRHQLDVTYRGNLAGRKRRNQRFAGLVGKAEGIGAIDLVNLHRPFLGLLVFVFEQHIRFGQVADFVEIVPQRIETVNFQQGMLLVGVEAGLALVRLNIDHGPRIFRQGHGNAAADGDRFQGRIGGRRPEGVVAFGGGGPADITMAYFVPDHYQRVHRADHTLVYRDDGAGSGLAVIGPVLPHRVVNGSGIKHVTGLPFRVAVRSIGNLAADGNIGVRVLLRPQQCRVNHDESGARLQVGKHRRSIEAQDARPRKIRLEYAVNDRAAGGVTDFAEGVSRPRRIEIGRHPGDMSLFYRPDGRAGLAVLDCGASPCPEELKGGNRLNREIPFPLARLKGQPVRVGKGFGHGCVCIDRNLACRHGKHLGHCRDAVGVHVHSDCQPHGGAHVGDNRGTCNDIADRLIAAHGGVPRQDKRGGNVSIGDVDGRRRIIENIGHIRRRLDRFADPEHLGGVVAPRNIHGF